MAEDSPKTTENDPNAETRGFEPLQYSFRIGPVNVDAKGHALQLPFSVLFDNLIAVLWSMYGKDSKLQCGINQLRWALEFLKCFKVDYTYPATIVKIIKDVEKQIVELYAKVGGTLQKMKVQRELEEEQEIAEDETKKSNEEKNFDQAIDCVSYNEKDIMDKLNGIDILIDKETGESRALRELNLLGGRKTQTLDKTCKLESQSSKTYMIGALQKILNNTSEEGTITEVEGLIKGLKDQSSSAEGKKQSPTTDGKKSIS